MVQKARVDLIDDRVEKRQAPNLASRELYGTEMGRQVSLQCGHFLVPAVLVSEPEAGLIVFERVADAESLRRILPRASDADELIRHAARALAAIHSLGKPMPDSGSKDFSHGDFSVDNLFYVRSADQLYILDWSLPVWRNASQYTDRYHDLSIFLLSLFIRRIFYHKGIRQASHLARIFFDVYRENAEFDSQKLEVVFRCMTNEFLPFSYKLSRWRFVANYPSLSRCRRFVARLAR